MSASVYGGDEVGAVCFDISRLKTELQTEDEFMSVCVKQEPSLSHVKLEPEDMYNYASCKQNTNSEIKSEQIEVKRNDNVKNEHEQENSNLDRCYVCNKMLTVNQSHETVSQNISKYHGCGSSRSATGNSDNDCKTTTDSNEDGSLNDDIPYYCWKYGELKSKPSNVEGNSGSSRSSTRNNENDCETTTDSNEDASLNDNIPYYCWKYGELKSKPSNVEGNSGAMEMDNQLEPDLINPQQSGEPLASLKAKLFRCNICSKRFTRCGHLNYHIRTVHVKIRAFPCPHCPYKASHSGHLKEHILTHTREKNFKCNSCDIFVDSNYDSTFFNNFSDSSCAGPTITELVSTSNILILYGTQSKGTQPIPDCSKSESDTTRATNYNKNILLASEATEVNDFDLTGCHAIQRFKLKFKDGCSSFKGICDLEEIIVMKLKFGELLSVTPQPIELGAVEKFSQRNLGNKRSGVSCRNIIHGVALATKWRELQKEMMGGNNLERKKMNNKFTSYARSNRAAGVRLEKEFLLKNGLAPFAFRSYKEIEENCKVSFVVFNKSGKIVYNSNRMFKENIYFFLETENSLYLIKNIKGFCRNN